VGSKERKYWIYISQRPFPKEGFLTLSFYSKYVWYIEFITAHNGHIAFTCQRNLRKIIVCLVLSYKP